MTVGGLNRDDIYEALVGLHHGLDAEQSLLVSNRLILLLAEQIGDRDAVLQAIEAARLPEPVDRKRG
jgi:hypothetical protein